MWMNDNQCGEGQKVQSQPAVNWEALTIQTTLVSLWDYPSPRYNLYNLIIGGTIEPRLHIAIRTMSILSEWNIWFNDPLDPIPQERYQIRQSFHQKKSISKTALGDLSHSLFLRWRASLCFGILHTAFPYYIFLMGKGVVGTESARCQESKRLLGPNGNDIS